MRRTHASLPTFQRPPASIPHGSSTENRQANKVHDHFQQLNTRSVLCELIGVIIPSRCPEILTGAKRRLRVAVKDIFHVEGLKTSLNTKHTTK
ncbi:hypothetical protein B0H67DRAFT_573022 [Lasiosphaeris hirsuta]|uniref:Uncharacterized protein n=1 Tax=Lasiosphaeris hirsuta TaxID=260670 RepID=A0AA40AP26_9PEZI|nr:hypothetical protein B0H67DRAFT_573022 [Lasiosphaeris hirsuta]